MEIDTTFEENNLIKTKKLKNMFNDRNFTVRVFLIIVLLCER